MFSLYIIFQMFILQTESHWKLYLLGFLAPDIGLQCSPILTFFFSHSEHLWHLLSFGFWFPLDCILLNSCLLILHSLQLLCLTQFPASNAFERNICNVLLNPLDQSTDEFVFSLCSRLRLLNATSIWME